MIHCAESVAMAMAGSVAMRMSVLVVCMCLRALVIVAVGRAGIESMASPCDGFALLAGNRLAPTFAAKMECGGRQALAQA